MIQTVITHHCPKCDSSNIVRNGTDYKGDQKFHCHHCGAYGTLEPQSRYSEGVKDLILRAYRERVSMRGIERIFRIARQTLAHWLKQRAAKLPDLYWKRVRFGLFRIIRASCYAAICGDEAGKSPRTAPYGGSRRI